MVPLKPASRVPRIRVLAGGHLLIGFTILLGVVAAQAAANALHALVALLLAFQVVSGFRSFQGLRGLVLDVRVAPHVDVAGEAALVVRVRNGKRRIAAHSVEVTLHVEDGQRLGAGPAWISRVPAGGAVEVALPLRGHARGATRLREITVSSAWPCELFRRTLRFPVADEVLVRPRRRRLDPPERAAPSGPVRATRLRVVGEGDLRGLRPFRDGDSPRAIHWRTSARLGEPIVREDAGSGPMPWVAVLAPHADDADDVEASVERAAALARVAVSSGRALDLRVAGEERARLVARRSDLEALLDALARFVPGGAAPGGATPRARAFLMGRDARPPAGAGRVETAPFPWEAPAVPVPEPEAPAAGVRALAALLAGARREVALLLLLAAVVLGLAAQDAVAVAPQALAAVVVLGWGGRAEALGVGALGRLGLLALSVAFAFVPGGDMTRVLLRFLCAISAVSLLKPKAPREHGFLLGVALLETALAWALADGFGLLFAGLAFALLAHRALASWHRWRGALRVVARAGPVVCPPEEARGTRGAADRAALATLLLAVPIFLVLPRTEMPLLSLPGRSPGAGLGVGDEVRLRGLGALGDPDEAVGSAEPTTPAARRGAPYLRAAAFDVFDGRSWTDGGGEDVLPLDPTTNRTETFGPPLDDDPVRFALVIDAGVSARLPLLEGTSSILFRDPAPDRYGLHRRHGTVRAMHPRPVARHVYLVEAPSATVLPGPGPTTSADDPLLHLPPALRAELLPAVREAVRGLEGDRARAEALVAWVRDRARYDLSGAPSGPNPVGDFLFRTRRGHCEYFASALACCLRAAGIPARLVAGWHASRWNGVGGFWTLRRGDAHAWVEASLDGGAWVRLDATPAGVLDADPYDGFAGFFARLRDAVDFAWNRDVLAYDPTSQRKTLRDVADAVRTAGSALLARGGPWLAVPALLVVALFVLARRRSRSRAATTDPTASAVAFYARCLRALRRRGVSRRASEAPLAFAARAAASLDPTGSEALSAATDAFLRVRYGGRDAPPPGEIEAWIAAVAAPRGARKGGQSPEFALP